MQKMKATVFHGPNDIRVEEVPRPRAGSGEAVIRITLTTICGTDLHILRGEYPVTPGLVIGHEPVGVIEELGEVRMEMSKRMGAHVVLDPKQCDVIAAVKKLTRGGADVAIEALGIQETFENCLRCLRPGGTLSSLGVYSGKLQVPYEAFAAGIGDYKIVTTLCPGGKERMRRLMSMVQSKRFDPLPLLTHKFKLDQIVEAYDVFASRRDGCLKVAITP